MMLLDRTKTFFINKKETLLKFIKDNKKRLLSLFIVCSLSLVLVFNSGYAYSTRSSTIFVIILGIATVFFGILTCLFFPYKKALSVIKRRFQTSKYSKKVFVYYSVPIIFVLAVVFSYLFNINGNDAITVLHYVLLIVFSFILTLFVSFDTFKKFFVYVAEIICLYSLLIYCLDLITGVGIYTSRFTNVVNHTFNNFFFIHFSLINQVYRNCGPFWEPGLFATYLLAASIFAISIKDKRKCYAALALFSLTTITTFSTAGILLWFLLIPIFFLERKKKKIGIIVTLSIVSLFIIVITLALTGVFNKIPFLSKVFSKMTLSEIGNDGSFGTRIKSILIDINIFASHPIFGVGPNKFDSIYFSMGSGVVDAQTSTIFWFAGAFGFIGFLMTLLPLFSLFMSKHNKSVISSILISVIYFVCLMKEPHYSFALTWVLNFYLIKRLLCENHCLCFDSSNNNTLAFVVFGKKSNDSTLIKNASGTAIIKILSMGIGLIATPVYLAFFANPTTISVSGEITTVGKVTFGIWSTILSILVWILHFDMGIGNGLKNKVVEALAQNDRKRIKELISSAYIGNGVLSLVIMMVGLIIVQFIDVNALFGNNMSIVSTSTLRFVLSMVVVSICLELFLKVSLNLFQSIQKQTIASLVPLMSTTILIILCVFFRFDNPDESMRGISLFYFFAINLPLVVASIVIFAKPFRGTFSFKSFDFSTMKEVMKLGGLFFLIQVFILVYNSSDQILISNLWGANYAVDYKYYYEFYFAVAALCSAISLPIWSIAVKAVSEHKYAWARKLQKRMWYLWLVFVVGDLLIFASLQLIFMVWLGKNSIPVNYLYSALFALWSVLTCLSFLVTGFGNGLKALKTQLIVMGIGAAIKIPSVILLHNLTSLGWISVLIPSTITIGMVCIFQPIENTRKLRMVERKYKGNKGEIFYLDI